MKSKHQLYHPHATTVKVDSHLQGAVTVLLPCSETARSQFPLHIELFVCWRALFLLCVCQKPLTLVLWHMLNFLLFRAFWYMGQLRVLFFFFFLQRWRLIVSLKLWIRAVILRRRVLFSTFMLIHFHLHMEQKWSVLRTVRIEGPCPKEATSWS